MTLYVYKEIMKDKDCKHCVHQYNNRCYCDEGCKFADINPDGKFRVAGENNERR